MKCRGGLTPRFSPSGLNQPFHFAFGHGVDAHCLSTPAGKAANGGTVHCGCFPSEETALLMRGAGEAAEWSGERLQ